MEPAGCWVHRGRKRHERLLRGRRACHCRGRRVPLGRLGAVIPEVSLVPENNPYPFHNLFVANLRFDRRLKLNRWREAVEIVPFVDFFNLFNHAPAGIYPQPAAGLANRFGALNFDYAKAPAGLQQSDLTAARGRLNDTRRVMIGVRVRF